MLGILYERAPALLNSSDIYTPGSYKIYNSSGTLIGSGTVQGRDVAPAFVALPSGGFITAGYTPVGTYNPAAGTYPGFTLNIQRVSTAGSISTVQTVTGIAGGVQTRNINWIDAVGNGTIQFQEPGATTTADVYNPTTNALSRNTISLPASAFAVMPASGSGNNVEGVAVNASNQLVEEIACFAAGTCLLTDRGEVAVEDLHVGDHVIARRDGLESAVTAVWIGQRRVDIAAHPHPEHVRPIRFAPGALGDGVPSQPLLLSPDHALFMDGVLIAARQLANGANITVAEMATVRYFHLELDRHSVVLAEGVGTESYLDTGNRGQFSNGASAVSLHANFSRSDHPQAYAPLVTAGDLVQPIWQRLADRAVAQGYRLPTPQTTRDADLRLTLSDVRSVRPYHIMPDGRHIFMLHPDGNVAAVTRLASRHAAASDLRPWLDDRRQLGVAIGEIALWIIGQGGFSSRSLPINEAALAHGWWGVETDGIRFWRWTDGDSTLLLPPGCLRVDVTVTGTVDYHQPECNTRRAAGWVGR